MVTYDNPSCATWMLSHSFLWTCEDEDAIHLGGDHGASTHRFIGRLHQDKSGTQHWRWPADILSPSMTVWRNTISVFGDADVVLRADVVSLLACSPLAWSHLPKELALTGWFMEGITVHWMSTIVAVWSVRYSDKPLSCFCHMTQTWVINIPVGWLIDRNDWIWMSQRP